VVTAAALIMIAVFSGFILDDDVVVKSIGSRSPSACSSTPSSSG
jgi:uncharacterized membrane protein YdfJ with MMPL/SSD domain